MALGEPPRLRPDSGAGLYRGPQWRRRPDQLQSLRVAFEKTLIATLVWNFIMDLECIIHYPGRTSLS